MPYIDTHHDYKEHGSDRAAPASGRMRIFAKAAGLFLRRNGESAKRLLTTDDKRITLLRIREVTASDSDWNPSADALALLFVCIGGGGGGGGVDGQGAGTAGAGGGGAGGSYVEYFDTSPVAGYNIIVGAGGAGGVAGNNAGADGSTTRVAKSGSLIAEANSGGGGGGRLASSTIATVMGGITALGDTGTVIITGSPGMGGFHFAAAVAHGGNGGAAARGGGGGQGANTTDVGGAAFAGRIPGGGGAGACVEASTVDRAGGDGARGVVWVYEYGEPA